MAYGVFPSGGIGAMMDVLRGTRWSGWVPPEASVSLRKYLLVPQLIFYATRAPRDQHLAWERYWSRVRRTGATGEVLWDTGEQSELDAAARQLQLHADLALPLVDLGCGNGRQAGALTRYAPRVVGMDWSPGAVARARAEAAYASPTGPGNLEFRVADAAAPNLVAPARRTRAT